MKEYTIFSLLSVLIVFLIDKKLKINIFKRREFYVFLLVIAFFKFLVNGYLTKDIVCYNSQYLLGLRIGTIPLEDFIFGFSMVSLTIIFWEYFKNEK